MNSNLKPSDAVAVVGAIDPDANAAGTINTGWVNMADWGAIMAVIMAGTLGASATLDAKFEQATDGSGTGAKDIDGSDITQLTKAGSDDDKQAIAEVFADHLDINNGFTHVRLSLTTAAATSDSGALLLGFYPRQGKAVDSDADTVAEIVTVA